nr:hypothetical protein [Enterobacter hormaechei]
MNMMISYQELVRTFLNKSEMESDPFLLQKIMDQKLEGYDMPTADPVNYLNAGGSFGGTYAQ